MVELSSSRKVRSTGWLMQSVLPTGEAFLVVRQMQQRLLGWAAALTLFAGLVAWWWVRRQLQPLERSAERLDEMRQGLRPREPLPIERDDEIGKLANAFNGLLQSIVDQEALLAQLAATERVRKILAHVPGMVFQYYQRPDGSGAFPFASAAAQTASRQRGTAPVRVCCKKTLTDSSQNTQKQMNGPHQRLA